MHVQRRHAITRAGSLVVAAVCALLLTEAAGARADAPCDDLVVTHRPDGSTGRTDAVQITSQRIERGVEGWASVGWRTSPGTRLRAVEVVHDGSLRTLPGGTTTVEGPVTELRFCGSVGGTVAASDGVAVSSSDGTHEAAASSERGGRWLGLALTGAGIGAAVGAIVLRLSRGSRTTDSEGIR